MKRTLVFLFVLFVAACSSTPSGSPGSSPGVSPSAGVSAPSSGPNTLLASATAYQAALTIAVAYNNRPRCGPGAPIVCSNEAVVGSLRQLNESARAGLRAWEDAVFAKSSDVSQKQVAAQTAIANFTTAAQGAK